MTNPSVEGIEKALRRAIGNSGIKLTDIGYINAHGTGTSENDKTECAALKNIFGKELKGIPVSSIKSALGHAMGAASALEATACCLAIAEGTPPPTINFEEKDPECDVDCVPNQGRKKEVVGVLNNASAFGGNNACVVFKICA